jgi:hypothetical protein
VESTLPTIISTAPEGTASTVVPTASTGAATMNALDMPAPSAAAAALAGVYTSWKEAPRLGLPTRSVVTLGGTVNVATVAFSGLATCATRKMVPTLTW